MTRILSRVVLVVIQVLALSAWAATETETNEHQIKAAYLYRFAAYVEWPPSTFAEANTPVTIGVMGANEIVTELRKLGSERSANERGVKVRSLKPDDALTGIQILFISKQEPDELKRLLNTIQSQPVLVVTDTTDALDAGSIINFVPVDDHIRFEVSVVHAESKGIKISARLLGVAHRIETGRPQ